MLASISVGQLILVYFMICGLGLNLWWIFRGLKRIFSS